MAKRIEVDNSAFFFCCILILTVPLNWFVAAMFAAVVHEFFHAAAICMTGGHICRLRIGILGAEMEAAIPGRSEEIISAMAGPCGSFLLLLLCHSFPRISICGLVQGLYNLLPLYPLDGGRALLHILMSICPKSAERIMDAVEFLTAVILVAVCIYASFAQTLGIFPLFMTVFLVVKMRLRKIPCKQRKIKVQ